MKIFLDEFKIQKVIIPREGIIRRINLRAIEIKDDKNYNWRDPIEISVGLPHERTIDSAELIYILEQFIKSVKKKINERKRKRLPNFTL